MSEHDKCQTNPQYSINMNSFNQLLNHKVVRSNRKKPNGFTMIELMIGVAIVGTLSAVALPELSKAQNRAKDSAAESLLTSAAKECSLALILDPTTAQSSFADTQKTGEKFEKVTGNCVIVPATTGANATAKSSPTLYTVSATGQNYRSIFTDSTPGVVEEY